MHDAGPVVEGELDAHGGGGGPATTAPELRGQRGTELEVGAVDHIDMIEPGQGVARAARNGRRHLQGTAQARGQELPGQGADPLVHRLRGYRRPAGGPEEGCQLRERTVRRVQQPGGEREQESHPGDLRTPPHESRLPCHALDLRRLKEANDIYLNA